MSLRAIFLEMPCTSLNENDEIFARCDPISVCTRSISEVNDLQGRCIKFCYALQISGHPRNNLMTESSFLTVERLGDDEVWIPVATDADWETKYV